MKLPTVKPKILIYDLEVSPTLGWTYALWDTRVIRVEQHPRIMSVSWRWYGRKETWHLNMNDKDMLKTLWVLFDEADVVVAHNANRFDNKVAMAAFIKANMGPPSPYKTVDTLRVAKSVAKFNDNSLDGLCNMFGIGRKSTIKHSDLWHDCLQGDKKAWSMMKKYNNQDVDLLYQLYEKLRPYITNHPNLGDLTQTDGVCPKCGSSHLEKRGFNMSRAGKKQRYQCQNCGGWSNEANLKKVGRTVNA